MRGCMEHRTDQPTLRDELQSAVPLPGRREQPPEVELGDGSRLVLVDATASPIVTRIEADRISLADTMSRGQQPFAGYRRLK